MAQVADRAVRGLGGLCWLDVVYETTGQQLAAQLVVRNDAPEPVRVRIRLADGTLALEDWFGGGSEKNPSHPDPETTVPCPPGLSWRRSSKQTQWGVSFAYPSYPAEVLP